MKLSIVIPLYNKEKYIRRCLNSLLAQDIPKNDYEIIVVDDESTDSSPFIAQEYVEENENVHLYRQKNGGAGAARNKGFQVSIGEYIYFLDADDYVASNTFQSLYELAALNNLEILGFKTKYVSDGSLPNSLTENLEELEVHSKDGFQFIADHNFRNEAWWYIIKRSFLADTGITFTEGRFLQDSIFTATLLLETKKIAKVNFDVHRFVQVENSATTNRRPKHLLKFIDDLVYALEKFDGLIKGFDKSHSRYMDVVKVYQSKQQSFVFTLFIKAFRCPALKFSELKIILSKLKKLGVYPIDTKIGGIGGSKTSLIYNLTVVPVFNTKPLLFLSLKLNRLFSPN